jgi:hypothetical protein
MLQIIADAFEKYITVAANQRRPTGNDMNSQFIHSGDEFTDDKFFVFFDFVEVNGPILIEFNRHSSLLAISLR